MSTFSIEAFASGCKEVVAIADNRELATQLLFETYCRFLQSQTGSK
ncbi:MAG: hypothetical protein PVJ39_08830 [Gammaproteobacteria bacterium]|jgi:hypothetical protein